MKSKIKILLVAIGFVFMILGCASMKHDLPKANAESNVSAGSAGTNSPLLPSTNQTNGSGGSTSGGGYTNLPSGPAKRMVTQIIESISQVNNLQSLGISDIAVEKYNDNPAMKFKLPLSGPLKVLKDLLKLDYLQMIGFFENGDFTMIPQYKLPDEYELFGVKIKINKLDFSLIKEKDKYYLEGEGSISINRVTGKLFLKRKNGETGYYIAVSYPQNPLSLIPGLKVLDKIIQLRDNTIYFSNMELEDAQLGMTIKKGIGIKTKLSLNGIFSMVKTILQISSGEIEVCAYYSEGKFSLVPVLPPNITEIKLAGQSFGINKVHFNVNQNNGNYNVSLGGEFRFKGKTLTGEILILKENGNTDYVFKGKLSGSLNPLSFFPALEPFSLTFQDTYFVYSTKKYEDTELNTTIEKGFGIKTSVPFSGMLSPVKKIFGLNKETLDLYTKMGSGGVEVKARLMSGKKDPSKRISFGKLELEVATKPLPKFKILGSVYIKPDSNGELLEFVSSLSLDPVSLELAGTMLGEWKNPFGINGITMSNCALQGGISLQTGMPVSLGFAGDIDFFGFKSKAAVLLNLVKMNESLVHVQIPRLSMYELLGIVERMGVPISKDVFSAVKFKDVEIKVAPTDGQVGEIRIEKGIKFKGEMDFFGFKSKVVFEVKDGGLRIQGSSDRIDLFGVLLVTASRTNPMAFSGPYLDMTIKSGKYQALISGAIDIFGVKSEINLNYQKDNITFDGQTNSSWFNIHLSGSGSVSKKDF